MAYKTPGKKVQKRLGAGELGDSLGALRDGMLGELTREDEPDGSLDFPGRQCTLTTVADEATSFTGNTVKGVSDEVSKDSHSSLADTSLRVDLSENSDNVGRVRLRPLAVNLLASLLGWA